MGDGRVVDFGDMPDDQINGIIAKQRAAAPPPQQPYTGSILPFSTDTQGNASFDSNAGILGGIKRLAQSAYSAASAPGDVYSGKLATPYSGGSAEASPEVTDRALQFSTMFSPASAALRAGEIIPGEISASAGVPSAPQLKNAASSGYDAARSSLTTIPGDVVANMAQGAQQSLLNEHGIIPETAPKTYAILDKLANPPSGGFGTYPGLAAARSGLSALTSEGGTEGLAAQKIIPKLNEFIDAISPQAADARANYAAAMRSNSLTGDLDKANTGILEQAEARAHASHSGSNMDNAIRQRVATLLQSPQNLAGFSQSEIDALNNVVQGGIVRNASRRVGNFLGGGGGLGSLAATAMGAAAGSHLMPGIEGTTIGAALPTALGTSAKALENALARRSLNAVDEAVRARSPLGEAMAGTQVPAMRANRGLAAVLAGQTQPPAQPLAPNGRPLAPNGAPYW
jgi:hypothetical protein